MTFVLAVCLLFIPGVDSPPADSLSAGPMDDDPAAAGVRTLFESLDREIQEAAGDSNKKTQLAQM